MEQQSLNKSEGFRNTRCVDVSDTTIEEQRKTEWINTENLADFLDPADSSKTIVHIGICDNTQRVWTVLSGVKETD